MESALTAVPAEGPLRALLLGVTPALASIDWPPSHSLVAVDASLSMVQGVWPNHHPAVCGDWQQLPFAAGSYETVIGDGSLNCLRYPEGYRLLARTVSRVLREQGALILRCYIQPSERDPVEAVLADLPTIASFHHYKFRLLMALQQTVRQGIAVDEVYRFWAGRHSGGEGLPSGPGWEPAVAETIGHYRGAATVHTFPTLDELRVVMEERFDEIGFSIPSYPLGERCPTIVWKRR